MSTAEKLAEFFLKPVEKSATGADYAAAFIRIVEWFEGKKDKEPPNA